MSTFPDTPISPSEFFEGYVASVYGALELSAALADLELALGVCLEGEGGGEWLYTLRGGELSVSVGSRADALLTLIQSVDDWRGGLWEGRGGIVAEKTLGLLRGGGASTLGALAARAPKGAGSGLVAQLAGLDGLMRAVVTGGPAGDWSTAFKFGPGEIPDEATTTISIRHDDASALARRELKPLEAFLAGRIEVAGDMMMVVQIQALVAAAGEAAAGRS